MDFQAKVGPEAQKRPGLRGWLWTHLAGSWQEVQLDVGVREAVVVHRLEPLQWKTGQLIADPQPKDKLRAALTEFAEFALRGRFRRDVPVLNF